MLKAEKTLMQISACLFTLNSFANCSTIIAETAEGFSREDITLSESPQPVTIKIEDDGRFKTGRVRDSKSLGSGLTLTLGSNERATAQGRLFLHFADPAVVVPKKLTPLYETFADFSEKIEKSDDPDIMDIVLLIDANGKFQTLTVMKFLAIIENMLMENANERHPDSNVKLFSCIDTAVGAGSGSIPTVIISLGERTIEESIPIVSSMTSENIMPKTRCGCLGGVRKAVKAGISAYTDKPYVISEDSPDWDSLTYDGFKLSKSSRQMRSLFGSYSVGDLRTCCEVISLGRSGNLIDLVSGALVARDNETKASIKRMAVAEVLGTATDIVAITDAFGVESKVLKHTSDAVNALGKIKIVSNNAQEKTKGTLTELRSKLLNRTDIARDLLILAITAGAYNGELFVPNFSYKIVQAENGKKIVNMDYRFMLPSSLYRMEDSAKIEAFSSLVETGISDIFKREGRSSTITTSAILLVEFLANCNKRALGEFQSLKPIEALQ
ncbi:MAG: hypothetical protein LBM19_00065 [Holosporales bacterium]|jgi:hypothetical protein|nr:hypothetical protein [Holosporales bacterium]